MKTDTIWTNCNDCGYEYTMDTKGGKILPDGTEIECERTLDSVNFCKECGSSNIEKEYI